MVATSDDNLKKEEHDTKTVLATTCSNEHLPVYYNSEPSSQPPQYINKSSTQAQSTSSAEPQFATTHSKPGPQHRNSAQAATVSAILASPYDDLDAQRRADRQNKTLRERWRNFKERNFSEYGKGSTAYGSAADLNVQGARLAGGLPTPYRRTERK